MELHLSGDVDSTPAGNLWTERSNAPFFLDPVGPPTDRTETPMEKGLVVSRRAVIVD